MLSRYRLLIQCREWAHNEGVLASMEKLSGTSGNYSRYVYGVTAIGQRTSRAQTGGVFGTGSKFVLGTQNAGWTLEVSIESPDETCETQSFRITNDRDKAPIPPYPPLLLF